MPNGQISEVGFEIVDILAILLAKPRIFVQIDLSKWLRIKQLRHSATLTGFEPVSCGQTASSCALSSGRDDSTPVKPLHSQIGIGNPPNLTGYITKPPAITAQSRSAPWHTFLEYRQTPMS